MPLKIIEILPELDIGGVERHVIDLANELSRRGHEILVISAGGQMLPQLAPEVEHRNIPVHKKNPFTALRCAILIAGMVRREGWQILHAHSRVPAWVAYFASLCCRAPLIVTAHVDFGSKSRWIYHPYRRAKKVICVSEAVRQGMRDCFYHNTQVILNGLDTPGVRWVKPRGEETKFLFVGRLSEVKGLQDVLKALPEGGGWSLDVLGDGPIMAELKEIAASRGIGGRAAFHGYAAAEVCDEYMAKSSCLLFPSYKEGMPLTLARAVQIGIPVIASDIAPVAEMCASPERLLPAGDCGKWREALSAFIGGGYVLPEWKKVPTLADEVDSVEKIYFEYTGK